MKVTTEWMGSPVEQHSFCRAGGCISRQNRAEALLTVSTGAHVIPTKPLEWSRIHQKMARAEHIWHDHCTRLFCITHWKGQMNICWYLLFLIRRDSMDAQMIPLLGFVAHGSVSCLWVDSQSPLILQACPKAWGLASTSPEPDKKSSPWFPL